MGAAPATEQGAAEAWIYAQLSGAAQGMAAVGCNDIYPAGRGNSGSDLCAA
jgi:hypothetical protein